MLKRLKAAVSARRPRDRRDYWEQRAPDLIAGYDHPETWPERGWMRAGIEEGVVPRVLAEAGVMTVLVIGAGTGRQYAFAPAGAHVRGFDVSPSLVAAAVERHPSVETVVDEVVDAELRHEPADAVLSTAVLQHVPPDQIDAAVASLKQLARKMIVLRELTRLDVDSDYQWAHDYTALFADWSTTEHIVTDDTDVYRVELMVLVP